MTLERWWLLIASKAPPMMLASRASFHLCCMRWNEFSSIMGHNLCYSRTALARAPPPPPLAHCCRANANVRARERHCGGRCRAHLAK